MATAKGSATSPVAHTPWRKVRRTSRMALLPLPMACAIIGAEPMASPIRKISTIRNTAKPSAPAATASGPTLPSMATSMAFIRICARCEAAIGRPSASVAFASAFHGAKDGAAMAGAGDAGAMACGRWVMGRGSWRSGWGKARCRP